MDVRCQKCGIEYEFDDAKVTAAGVTVKCTSCGHVFKVKRDEPMFGTGAAMQELPRTGTATTLPPVAPQDGAEWMVRQQSGTVFRFKELTTLQKWIVERKVAREDEISKTGRSWKRLGDIAELASFFQVVDAANAAQQTYAAPAPPLAVPPASLPPGFVVVHQHQTGQTQVGMQAVGAPAHQRTPDPQPDPPEAPAVPVAPLAPPPANRAASAALPHGTQPDLDDLDDDDPVLAWGRARKRRNAALLFVVALAVAAGVLVAARPAFLMRLLGAEDATGIDTQAVARALRDDDPAAVQAALTSVRAAPQGPAAAALAARLLCAEAAHAREEERLLRLLIAVRPADGPARGPQAGEAGQRASSAMALAYPLVARARAEAPRLVDAHLAAAAYNLEKAAFAELKTDLESARAVARPDAQASLDAELAVLQALADAYGALTPSADAASLSAAAERVPASADARLRYAKAALAVTSLAMSALARAPQDGPPRDAVTRLVDGLSVRDARHQLLTEIVAATAPPPAPADAGVALSDGGVADAGAAGAAVDAGVPDAGADDGAADSYETLMQRAERASLNEKHGQARELFLRAVRLRPTSPRAHLGLAWAALNLDKNAEAQKAFRKVIALDEENSDAHFGLAEALRFGGNKAAALDEYRTYVKMDPNGRDAAVARRAIEALQ